MLEYLHIHNLALIEDVALELVPGINALTGETGAGKSFILKAIGFLLGDRLKSDMVRPGCDRAFVEGLFRTADGELILRRELVAETGRSRFFCNNTLHTQDFLKELRPKLVTYTSQHAQQLLLQPAFQAKLIENTLPHPNLLVERDALLDQIKEIAHKQAILKERQKTLLERRDLLEMQKAEIDKINPEEGEEERLEAIRQQIKNRRAIIQSYDAARDILLSRDPRGLFDSLTMLEKQLGNLQDIDESFAVYTNACLDFRAHLDALVQVLQNPPETDWNIDSNAIEERLYALAQLKRKLHRSLPAICSLHKELEESLSFLDSCALDYKQLEKEEAQCVAKLQALIDTLRPERMQAAKRFCERLEQELKDLAFSEHVRVIPDPVPQTLWKDVTDDRIRFLWAPNPGQAPQPLDHIASGGELSRFLLALTSLEKKDDDQTFIFDEVDAGVGGFTLGKLAEKLVDLAKTHQIILITHWPQLARYANRHFLIQKTATASTTKTSCVFLDERMRKKELSRMAGEDFAMPEE
ncbi:MAG: AAA family ATPase [Desulfovibrio sp.]|nr:AAA family ATPase [Desulfovibrio sp.]